jgi:CBS domain-containing protein
LRIENRVLPAGPSIVDEVANAAFWLGLMVGCRKEHDDITKIMNFEDVRSNFVATAFSGHDTELTWIKGQKISVSELIKKELLPLARMGLQERKVKKDDIDKYLSIIEERNTTRRTGANWILNSYAKLSSEVMTEERSSTITAAMVKHQKTGKPVHEWELACRDDVLDWSPTSLLIEEFMTREVFTVSKDDIPELVANIMDWQKVRFIPVEDDKGHLIGLISSRMLIRYLLQKNENPTPPSVAVGDIMIKNPITITPEKTVMEAMQVMQKNNAACLPVVKNGALVGIISEGNFLNVTKSLLNIIHNKKPEN